MWLLGSQAIYTVVMAIMNVVLPYSTGNPVIARISSLPQPFIGNVIASISVLGLFIDLPVFFACLSILFAWRLVWGIVRIYRVVLELIPMLG